MSCPPTKPAIAVITPNILIGLGLRTILEKVGPPGEIAVFDSFTEFIASGPERYFHYFAAMQVFMRHRTFFLEKCPNSFAAPTEAAREYADTIHTQGSISIGRAAPWAVMSAAAVAGMS